MKYSRFDRSRALARCHHESDWLPDYLLRFESKSRIGLWGASPPSTISNFLPEVSQRSVHFLQKYRANRLRVGGVHHGVHHLHTMVTPSDTMGVLSCRPRIGDGCFPVSVGTTYHLPEP